VNERVSRAALQGHRSPPPPVTDIRLRYQGDKVMVAIEPPFRGVGLKFFREDDGRTRVLWRGRLCEKASR
jgi:hypothetical protein